MSPQRARYRGGSVRVDVDVDVDDILEELTDDELRGYCEERGIIPATKAASGGVPGDKRAEAEEWASEMWAAFVSQDRLHFRVLIERLMPPYPPITGDASKEKAA